MVDWSWLFAETWTIVPIAEADPSPWGLESSVLARLGCLGTFYMGVVKVTKYIHEQLHEYKSVQCVWREVVLCCSRKHLMHLGQIFSENLWLTQTFLFVGMDFKDLCHAAVWLSSFLIVAHRCVHIYTTEDRRLRLLLCMTTSCLWYARYMQATWQQLLCLYFMDITMRLAPWPTHTGPRTKQNGTRDKRYKCNRVGS
jgi:hypothetical protein